MTKIGNAFPTDPLARALGLGKNLLPNSQGGPFKQSNSGNAVDSLPIPNPQPPVSAAVASALNAMNAYAKSNAGKKSFADTVFAGNTGGYFPGESGYPGFPGGAGRPRI